jgi:hypothetical protein
VGQAFLAVLPKGILDRLSGVWNIGSHVKGTIFQIMALRLDGRDPLVGRPTLIALSPTLYDPATYSVNMRAPVL